MYAMSWKIPARNPAAEIFLPRTHAYINPISTGVVFLPYAIFWRVQVVIVTTWTLAADPSLAWMDSVPSLPHIHWW
jgi:hypothetical protein